MVENVARADVAGWLLRVLPERWQGPVRLIRPTSCDKPWDKPAQIGRESGGIGRRGRLKICCPSKTWGFESPLSHHAYPILATECRFDCDRPHQRLGSVAP